MLKGFGSFIISVVMVMCHSSHVNASLASSLAEQLRVGHELITIPHPLGDTSITFLEQENQTLPASLAQRYPAIRTFQGVRQYHPLDTIRIELTSQGVTGQYQLA